MNTLVIDTNIIISALIRNGASREILTNLGMNFLFPEFGLKEIYFYKNEIIKKAGLSPREFDILVLRLLKYVKLIPLEMITEFREEADKIMGGIDKKDTVFIATALTFECHIWSEDKHFKKQKRVKIITTKELLEIINQKRQI